MPVPWTEPEDARIQIVARHASGYESRDGETIEDLKREALALADQVELLRGEIADSLCRCGYVLPSRGHTNHLSHREECPFYIVMLRLTGARK